MMHGSMGRKSMIPMDGNRYPFYHARNHVLERSLRLLDVEKAWWRYVL